MTDKERKEAVKRLRAENKEFKKALKWMRYFEYREVFPWSMSKETFETLQRLVGGPVKDVTIDKYGNIDIPGIC